jgi:hypothetical protein
MPRQEKPLKTRLHHVQQHRLAMPGLEAMSLVTEQSFRAIPTTSSASGFSLRARSVRGAIWAN